MNAITHQQKIDVILQSILDLGDILTEKELDELAHILVNAIKRDNDIFY